MSTDNETKINQLLRSHSAGGVFLSAWLAKKGYSLDLQKRYRKSRWLAPIGTGAMIRAGEKVGYEGGLYALQAQAGMTIHPGGRTALAMQGKAHYLEMGAGKAVLFGNANEKLPTWFKKYDWGVEIEYHPTSFLPPKLGMIELETKTFSLRVSGPVRALMECLYLAPEKQELVECLELMEGLNNARPQLVQSMLEQCQSVKVKRLFLYLAEKVGHKWVEFLDLKKVDLGKGKRSLVKNGVLVPKYAITVPKELESHERTI